MTPEFIQASRGGETGVASDGQKVNSIFLFSVLLYTYQDDGGKRKQRREKRQAKIS